MTDTRFIEPAPDLAPDNERSADPDVGTEGTEPGGGTDRGGGSDPAPPADTGGDGSDYQPTDFADASGAGHRGSRPARCRGTLSVGAAG